MSAQKVSVDQLASAIMKELDTAINERYIIPEKQRLRRNIRSSLWLPTKGRRGELPLKMLSLSWRMLSSDLTISMQRATKCCPERLRLSRSRMADCF